MQELFQVRARLVKSFWYLPPKMNDDRLLAATARYIEEHLERFLAVTVYKTKAHVTWRLRLTDTPIASVLQDFGKSVDDLRIENEDGDVISGDAPIVDVLKTAKSTLKLTVLDDNSDVWWITVRSAR